MKFFVSLGLMGLLVATSATEAAGRRGRFGGGNDSPQAVAQKPVKAPVVQEKAQIDPVVGEKAFKSREPEVDKDEVIRRGDLEEYVDGESKFSTEYGDHITQIAAVPADDNNKWFIRVIGRKNCPACDSLQAAWKTDDTLRAYAKPEDPRASWAHYTYYDYNDPYQSWRWKKTPQNPNPIEITAFPTIVIQPPRDRKYGPPEAVVLKYVWEGDPQKFSAAANGAIRAYVDSLHKANQLQDPEPEKMSQERTSAVAAKATQRATPPKGFEAMEEEVMNYSQELAVTTPAPKDNGFGQVQVPPLNLPNERPNVEPRDERRQDKMISAKPRILIVTDEQLVQSQEQNDVLKKTVDAVQPPEGVKVYKVDYKDLPKKFNVKPEEVPVVMLVEGDDVIEKRQVPRVNAEFGGPFLAIWSGIGSVISLLVWVVSSVCSMLVILFIVVVGAKTLQHFEILPKPLWGGAKVTPTDTKPTV